MYGHLSNKFWNNITAQPSFQWPGATSTSLTAILIALSIAILSAVFRSDDKIHNLGGFHLVAARDFFSRRYDFLHEHFKKAGVKIFRFRLAQHRVVAMAGEANRKVFFNNRNLSASGGYCVFMGGIPNFQDINVHMDESGDGITEFIKRLSLIFRKEWIDEVIPLLLEDINHKIKDWGTEGKINPFDEVYDLVFQMTVRMASCRELSEDREAVSRVEQYFWDIERNATATSILFPWFPSSAKKAKQKATMALYTMLLSYVEAQRKHSTPSMSDPINMLISDGKSDNCIVGTIVAIISSAVNNTGINVCWALLHIGTNPDWRRKAIDEYKALIDKYTDTTSSNPLHTRLSTIPLKAWEDELPSLDLIIRETVRLSGSLIAFRRNIGKDIQVGEAIIKRGDFLVCSLADANLSPGIYTNPMTFDPDRYGPGREEHQKESLGYLAWGAGRHPCHGEKIAKLEMKLVLAMILLGCEYELVDGKGNYLKAIPQQDRNNVNQSRPIGDPCYLKYKRIVE